MDSEALFKELSSTRRLLAEVSRRHLDTLREFREAGRPYFRNGLKEDKDDPNKPVRHLSSTATCLGSLLDIPDDGEKQNQGIALAHEIGAEFGPGALDRAQWESEGSGPIYCRVRALPTIIQLCRPAILGEKRSRLDTLIKEIWGNVKPKPAFQGVGEYPLDGNDKTEHYPPNTFHTYWAFKTVLSYQTAFGALPPIDQTRCHLAATWSERILGFQVTLKQTDSESFDGQQLGWALATRFLLDGTDFVETWTRETSDLVSAGLKAFFSAQTPRGSWPRYRPLFHYQLSGNAYCYQFETLAELLRFATLKSNALWAKLFWPHYDDLKRALAYIQESAQPIDLHTGETVSPTGVAWCSNHHPHRTAPESWATASVLSFVQSFRRLVGYWTSEEAAKYLKARTTSDGEQKLIQRGRTWTKTEELLSAGDQVAGLFLHPVRALERGEERDRFLNPDSALIPEDCARGAILFGPPGTSKTTLAECLAGALGWRYVDIHASDFLSEGMDRIPAQADKIFARIMELDRCVVLFDEIDELVRERAVKERPDGVEHQSTDPFGRFLTTLMLPKLAALWKQRRVIYFVATNLIDEFDSAIKRSQRFDASIFVPPPAFIVKINDLKNRVSGGAFDEITIRKVEEEIVKGNGLGAFALVRHDQYSALAANLRSRQPGEGSVKDCIERVVPNYKAELKSFLAQREQETRDISMSLVARLSMRVKEPPSGFEFFPKTKMESSPTPGKPAAKDETPAAAPAPETSGEGAAPAAKSTQNTEQDNAPGNVSPDEGWQYVKLSSDVNPPGKLAGPGWTAKREPGLLYTVPSGS